MKNDFKTDQENVAMLKSQRGIQIAKIRTSTGYAYDAVVKEITMLNKMIRHFGG